VQADRLGQKLLDAVLVESLGVLEVRLSAHQGTVNLDTVSKPVSGFLVFSYELMKGTSSDGSSKGDNLYPAPTLRANPGERMIVHFDNDLQGLTIQDFYDPAFTPAGGQVPLYPRPLGSAPLNLHAVSLHTAECGLYRSPDAAVSLAVWISANSF